MSEKSATRFIIDHFLLYLTVAATVGVLMNVLGVEAYYNGKLNVPGGIICCGAFNAIPAKGWGWRGIVAALLTPFLMPFGTIVGAYLMRKVYEDAGRLHGDDDRRRFGLSYYGITAFGLLVLGIPYLPVLVGAAAVFMIAGPCRLLWQAYGPEARAEAARLAAVAAEEARREREAKLDPARVEQHRTDQVEADRLAASLAETRKRMADYERDRDQEPDLQKIEDLKDRL